MSISAEEIVRTYSEQVFALVFRILRNYEDAQEVTQDVFIKVFDALPAFRGGSSLSTWIYRIAYNAAVSRCRKRRTTTTSLTFDIADGELDELSATEREQTYILLENNIAKLSAEDQLLLQLYYWKELDVAQIADIVKQSKSNVKIRLFRLRNRLQQLLEQ